MWYKRLTLRRKRVTLTRLGGLEGRRVHSFVPLLSAGQIERLPPRAREVVEYRKSGLSLNHIQGCPLDCAYCIRHTYGLWDQRQPRALMSDAEAVARLVGHPYFRPGHTPVQLFNRATEPFLPAVRPHTFAVLEDLDARGLTNHVLVITRHQLRAEDCERLNRLAHLKVTLLFTYSGIEDRRIEPYPSEVAAASLRLATGVQPRRYRTILYWRPLVPGLNDTDEHLARAAELSQHADATVFTGLFYRDEIATYYQAAGLPEPYAGTARRKVVPETLERRVLDALAGRTQLFRKTSCAVSYVHGLPDLQRPLRRPGTVRHLPRGAAPPVRGGPPDPDSQAAHGAGQFRPGRRRAGGPGHHRPGRRGCRPPSRAAALLPSARPRFPDPRRAPSSPQPAPRPRRHRMDGARCLMTDWTSVDYAVVDVEGNGQQPPDLVELAIVPITAGVIGEPTTWLLRPERPITGFARRIHGITNAAVADAPVVADVEKEIRSRLEGVAFVAHNAHVDLGVLRRNLPGWEPQEVFDTLKLARRLRPERVSYRLGSLVQAFGLAQGLAPQHRPHRATYDALVTARLFVLLATVAEGHPLSLAELRDLPPGGDDAPPTPLF